MTLLPEAIEAREVVDLKVAVIVSVSVTNAPILVSTFAGQYVVVPSIILTDRSAVLKSDPTVPP